jgi:CHAD domain-containing protein
MAGELERVRKTLRELGKLIESLPADPAPQKVHKLRTASRRVEAAALVLETAHPKKSRRLVSAIEPVRKAAGGVRDMDVLTALARKLARHGARNSLAHLLAHLENIRQQNARELARVLHRRRKTLLETLKEYSRFVSSALKQEKSDARFSSEANQYQENIHTAAMNVVRELGHWLPLDASNLHEFRLKVKELRYTLQLDEDADPGLVAALGDVQRHIGDWHDWQQLSEIAHRVLTLEEDKPLIDRIDVTAGRRLDRALAAANALRAKYLSMPLAIGI